jgi:hypothetical protein
MSALGFVLLPLLIYLPMFFVEFYISFRRIGKPLDSGGEYLHATWEVTHTFLILSVNYFMWLFSDAIVDVGKAVFVPLITFGAIFIVRAILYVYLFYIKKTKKPNLLADWLFALCHVVMLVCLLYIAIATISVLLNGNYTPNDFLPALLYPGLFLMVPLVAMPIYFLYKTRAK